MVAIDDTRIHAEVRLENTGDRCCFNDGYGKESDIRRSTVDAIVDTSAGASMPLHTATGSIGEPVSAMHSISSTVIASDIRS